MHNKYDKERIMADLATGEYTHRVLAHKHKVSKSLVTKLNKLIDRDYSDIVAKKVEVDQALENMPKPEADAINFVVSEKLKLLRSIEVFADKTMTRANHLMDNSETGADLNQIVQGVGKLASTMGVNQEKPTTNITTTTNIQNNLGDEREQLRKLTITELNEL
jgi:hypothetical protein